MAVELTVVERLNKARITLTKDDGGHPYFSYLLMHMRGQAVDKSVVPTMGVDARGGLWYCEEYVKSISDEELIGVLCHEALHVVLHHLVRRSKSWNPQLANVAEDILVNHFILQEGFTLPSNTLTSKDGVFTFDGRTGKVKIDELNRKTVAEVYSILETNARILKVPSKCPLCGGTGKVKPKQDSSGKSGPGKGEGQDKDGDQGKGQGKGQDQDQDQDKGQGKGQGKGGEQGESGGAEHKCPMCGGSGGLKYDLPSGHDIHMTDRDPDGSEISDEEAENASEEWKLRSAEASAIAKQR